jgi:hypothetical protein
LGLSSEHLHSVIPPGLAEWKAYLFPSAATEENEGLFASLHKYRPIQNFEEGKSAQLACSAEIGSAHPQLRKAGHPCAFASRSSEMSIFSVAAAWAWLSK